jgi:hypothetical protein
LDRRLRNGQQWLGERKTRQRGRDDDGGKLRHALLIGFASGMQVLVFARRVRGGEQGEHLMIGEPSS